MFDGSCSVISVIKFIYIFRLHKHFKIVGDRYLLILDKCFNKINFLFERKTMHFGCARSARIKALVALLCKVKSDL